MERVTVKERIAGRDGQLLLERERRLLRLLRLLRCLRCGLSVPDYPRGCKGAYCENCGYPYPLGDCSD